MNPFGKCIGIAAVLATIASVLLCIFVVASAKVGDGIGKVFPLIMIAGWILSFVALYPLTSISFYIRARRNNDSFSRVRELRFSIILCILILVVFGASIITRLK